MYNKNNSGHDNSLQVGWEFQDFVCMQLAKRGIIIQNIQSKKFQHGIGENIQGFEIKYDARCTGCSGTDPTYRLSIELAEKGDSSWNNYVKSGIYSVSNSWMYIQGNYNGIWIFSTKHLRMIYETNRYKESEQPTIKTFFLPVNLADKYCLVKYDFTEENKNGDAVIEYINQSKEIYKQLHLSL